MSSLADFHEIWRNHGLAFPAKDNELNTPENDCSIDQLMKLDAENTELEKQVLELEGKVRALQDLEPDLEKAGKQLDEKNREFEALVQLKQKLLSEMVRK